MLVWAGALTASAASSTLDGVFTQAQAKRGEAVYVASCAGCHGKALEGSPDAPELVGALFVTGWSGTTVGDLVERVRKTMPDDSPGTLTREQYTDVIAFVLSSNKYPAGKTELPTETDKQKQIKIEAIK